MIIVQFQVAGCVVIERKGSALSIVIAAEPDLTECDREPITRLDRIQHFGFLVALSNDWTVIRASANLHVHLGIEATTAIGRNFSTAISEAAQALVRSRMATVYSVGSERLFGVSLDRDRPPFDLNLHFVDDILVIEGEPSQPTGTSEAASLVRSMMVQLSGAITLEAFHRAAAGRIRDVTGFDRVMIYRFDPSGHGEVIAESTQPGIESFLGLHYPATDIPQQARALYVRNPFRIISDVGETPVPLLPEVSGTVPALDLAQAITRAVSPVHIEYLANMGVGATMSISIIVGGELWGLFACHHYAPRLPSFAMRTVAELFGSMYSLALESRLGRASAMLEQRARLLADRLIGAVAANEALLSDPVWLRDMMREIIAYDGIALYRAGEVTISGATPSAHEVVEISKHLNLVSPSRVFATAELGSIFAGSVVATAHAAGLLAIPISRTPRDYIMLFRREQLESIRWAGEPGKGSSVETGFRMSPRKSFAAFAEVIRGKSLPFSEADLRLGEAVRSALVEVILRLSAASNEVLSAEISTRRLMATAIAHELNQPLGAIASYLNGIARLAERGPGDSQASAMIAEAMGHAAGQAVRAGDILKLLRSSITRDDTTLTTENIETIIAEAIAVAAEQNRKFSIEFSSESPVPTAHVLINRIQIGQVLANLIQNAVEAVAGTERREISITTSRNPADVMITIAVADTGPGVAADHVASLFTPFASNKPNGMGVGLSISREIVEAHFGKLTTMPNSGGGAIFSFTLPMVTTPEV
jgi:light-regulated signal transduction histidine kinase (bacteriophytochrome)